MRTRRTGLEALSRGLGIALIACFAMVGCGLVDQISPIGEQVPNAPSVPPVPAPPDLVTAPVPIDGAVWEVDGHPASIVDVRVVSGRRIAYLSNWGDVGLLTASGDAASWPLFTTRGWMGSRLDAWPDGRLLAASTNAGIEVWDADSGLLLGVLGHAWARMAVSPDGARIAVPAAVDGVNRVMIWNPVFGGWPHPIAVNGAMYALTWSPDATRLAIASDELLVLDVESEEVVWRAELDSGNGSSLRWNVAAPLVAHIIGSTVTVFEVGTSERWSTTLSQEVAAVHWADLDYLTVLTEGGIVLSLAYATGLTSRIGSVPEFTLAFEPLDDARAAIGTQSGSAGIWNFATGRAERLVTPALGRGEAVAMSPDGLRLATGGDNGLVRTWRIADGAMLRERQMGQKRIDNLAWSPDSRSVAVASYGYVELFDGSTLERLASSSGHWPGRGTLAFGPSGGLLVPGGVVLDDSTLEPIIATDSYGIAAAWGPEGASIAIGTFDGDVDIYETASGSMVESMATSLDAVRQLAWSPDGSAIAVANYYEVVVIDAGSGARRFSMPLSGVLTSLGYSHDSTYLVTTGWASAFGGGCVATVRFWDTVAGMPHAAFGGMSTAAGVAISPDGRHAALANWSGKVAYLAIPEIRP